MRGVRKGRLLGHENGCAHSPMHNCSCVFIYNIVHMQWLYVMDVFKRVFTAPDGAEQGRSSLRFHLHKGDIVYSIWWFHGRLMERFIIHWSWLNVACTYSFSVELFTISFLEAGFHYVTQAAHNPASPLLPSATKCGSHVWPIYQVCLSTLKYHCCQKQQITIETTD